MKTKLFIFFALLLVGTAASFAQKAETVKVGIDQAAALQDSDLKIVFVSVTEDSRCRAGADCVWAGRVIIQVALSTKGNEKALSFSTAGEPQITEIYGYKLQLVSVTPEPSVNKVISPNEYVAEFKIERPAKPHAKPVKNKAKKRKRGKI